MCATLITVAKKWRGVKITPTLQLELTKMREHLYQPSAAVSTNEEADLQKAA